MDYYLAIKRNGFESVVVKWINLEPVIQSKSEREKQMPYINAYIYMHCSDEPFLQGRNRDTDRKNGLVATAREGEQGELRGEHGVKQLVGTWSTAQRALRGVLGGPRQGVGGGSRRRRIYIYLYTYS